MSAPHGRRITSKFACNASAPPVLRTEAPLSQRLWGRRIASKNQVFQRTPGSFRKGPGVLDLRPRLECVCPTCVLPKDPGVLLKDPGVLLKDPGVFLKGPGVLLRDPGVLLKDPGIL